VAETYEMKVTPLVDAAEENAAATLRVVVTGGYLRGGYYSESSQFGVLEIVFEEGKTPSAKWIKIGVMTPRSNHSATFVPPRLAGTQFPEGYLLVFGGNVNGRATDSLEVLDLRTYKWTPVHAEGEAPGPRNSHTATLVEGALRNLSLQQSPRILILGGGNGDGTNGGPPRGGQDFSSAYWLHGLEGVEGLQFARASEGANGRGHTACLMAGTGTVLAFGGGRPPTKDMAAYLEGRPQPLENCAAASSSPQPRAFGGGCGLPDGTVLVYGGWHPRGGTFGDFWAAHAGASPTKFFAQLPEDVPQDATGSEDDMDQVDPRLRFLISRLSQGGGGGAQASQFSRLLWPSALPRRVADSDDDEDVDEEDDEPQLADSSADEAQLPAEEGEDFAADLEADFEEQAEEAEEERGGEQEENESSPDA
jgi:hypothetical protein